MKRKINDMEFQDLKQYAESLEKRIARLESVLCKMIEGDVKKMAEKIAKDMSDYEEEWGSG
tara:strand:+ start:724 stop:906 length:183 start_codon:yes stop_codon:yes gene_type:complete